MNITTVSIPGYLISEELYNGSRTLVSRGYRESDSLRVVIKLLKNPYPSFSELVQFRNQYTIAKNLNSPLIIQTYSLEPYQNGYALVMEDFGGISLKEWGTGENRRNITEFLQIAIALCNALDILYRDRIIHKDIKPANILINPETKQVKLIDFSIASLLPRETQTLMNPNVLEGTLSYISPEQTGRMNRGIDYRTDLYSLGVTFYELLTGELPFQSNDPMELVHCHLAKLPPNINKTHPKPLLTKERMPKAGEVSFPIPQVLCDIVMKLMAKNAEDRYQSALGLKFDLENCLSQLQETGEMKSFSIAQLDVCDRFIIPDKLYGRETEVETLLQAFERVSLGATEMMLVAGFSGIGKTVVINEVHKPIVRQRGYFIKGKFDQFQRNIPLSALVQAFRDFMEQLLTESDNQIQQWKSKILEAVGENGQVIIEVIPELERIIGQQPSPPELSGNVCLEQGHSSLAAFAYGSYGVFLCAVIGDVDTAYYSSQIALKLLEEYQSKEISSKIYMIFGVFICAYKEHGRNTLTALRESIQCGLEVGDIEHASYSMMAECTHLFLMGETLDAVEERQTKYINLLLKLKQKHCVDYAQVWRQITLNLLGRSSHQYYLTGVDFDETEMLPHLHNTHNHQSLFAIYLAKTAILYTFDQYEQAASNAEKATEYMDGAFGLLLVVAHNFYYSLCLLAKYSSCDRQQDQQESWLNQVASNQKLMHYWASYAPVNFQHKYDLVEAETARVMGDKLKAMEHYDRAISLAKANGYIQEEALSNELAAKFYLAWDKEKVAQAYMQEAYYCYARWGAKAKIEDLEKRYPQLLQPILQQQRINLNPSETIAFHGTSSSTRTSSAGSTSISDALDFTSVLKAAQTISSSLELDQLVASLTRIIQENSGAKKAALILPQEDTWQVRAITSNSQIGIQTILEPQSLDNCQDIPVNIINYVKNTKQTVVIDNCTTNIIGLIGEYMHRTQPQSVLCTPIINQGRLVGILYLENRLTQGVFTSDRLSIINFLCTQAAIFLENAQLYNHLQERGKFLSSIYEGVGCLIFVTDIRDSGRFEYTGWSKSCELAVGIPASQMLGKTPQEVIGSNEGAAVEQKYLDCCQKGIPVTYEECLTFNHQKIWWLTTLSPLKDEMGKVYRIVGTTINISDRKQAEEGVIEKSQALGTALADLQQAQLQIVQSEKMSALGNLVAGVAHEMNNPLGFITASLQQAKPTIADIIEHLKLYQASSFNADDQIKEHAEEIDLDYTLEDLPKILDSMVIACDRLKNISTSLRTFSRADKDYKVPFNIHEGIESTILILKHRLKENEQRPAIEVTTDYANLPKIQCLPGQLNQVFMNILANAIDALEESNTGRTFQEIKKNRNQITIKTSWVNGCVKIAIADNGNGMNEEVKQKIFDHLFTTKVVGKGTGFGLAIAHQIVTEKHGGAIEVDSRPGEGTEFVIHLPI
ncbi:AAA family ATPase [Nostoc flagelliforme FACHB-838]|uniref:histidine kinase n=1 Tax=Nostoc flagelliforme FACHB-838 TaxID=2692904 RepID=A0ABR8DHC7_9NOSO|nr:AAA family ATPase [Nostoc flagelliforme]MBD2528132.1 AAA family ATPase [Nostoc flagelliforme FACHB-838]